MRAPGSHAHDPVGLADAPQPDDSQLVRRALARDGDAFRVIMTANNRRLYRLARGVVDSAAEAEDVVQEAYVRAFANLGSFRGESSLSTWLSRIVLNEALGRTRKRRHERMVIDPDGQAAQAQVLPFPSNGHDDPERAMAQRQILQLVEKALNELPSTFRSVFVARVIEGLSLEETADLLGIRAETVKTRLHRARSLVRNALAEQIGPVLMDAYPFAGHRCERLTESVLRRLGLPA
jgi:RNA polymerase sigma-70 factor (ECF subfamily)